MNREEARLILQSYRPGGQDAADPYFADALALAKTDAELAAWFAAEQKFDARFSRGLQQVRGPAQLKKEILALQKKSSPPKESPFSESSISLWWRNLFIRQSPVAWAFAVLILVVLSVAIFWKKPEGSARFADYSAQMVSTSVNDPHHVDADLGDLKQATAWLAAHRGENNLVLPGALTRDQGLMGCRVLDWRGQKVSMLCYMLQGAAHVDVFVVAANIFPDAPPLDQPQFAERDGLPTASWTHAGKVYLAISHGNEAILKNLLAPEKSARVKNKFNQV